MTSLAHELREERAAFGVTPRPLRTRKLARVRVAGVDDTLDEGSWLDVQKYADRIERYTMSLNKDAQAQIVFDDPFVIAEMIKKAKAGGYIGDLSLPLLEKYLAEAMAKVKARGGEEQAKKDLEWAARWAPYLAEWKAWNETVHGWSPGMPPASAWSKQQHFEARLRDLNAAFLALGDTHITEKLPATLETFSGKPEDPNPGGIPWKPILYVGGAIGVGYVISAIAHLVRG